MIIYAPRDILNASPPPTTSVAVVGRAEPSPPVVAVGLDWSVIIPLVFTGIALLITTTFSAWSSFRTKAAVKETKATVDANAVSGAAAGAARDAKLDYITVLVNGRYSLALQEIADVRRLLAATTGRLEDHAKAEAAQSRADDQAKRVAAAAPSTPQVPA